MNSLRIDITGKRVVVKKGIYHVGDSEAERTFQCEGGFGCKSFTSGQAVYGFFVSSPDVKGRIDGSDIEKLAEESAAA